MYKDAVYPEWYAHGLIVLCSILFTSYVLIKAQSHLPTLFRVLSLAPGGHMVDPRIRCIYLFVCSTNDMHFMVPESMSYEGSVTDCTQLFTQTFALEHIDNLIINPWWRKHLFEEHCCIRLPWWPPAGCSNALMYMYLLIFAMNLCYCFMSVFCWK